MNTIGKSCIKVGYIYKITSVINSTTTKITKVIYQSCKKSWKYLVMETSIFISLFKQWRFWENCGSIRNCTSFLQKNIKHTFLDNMFEKLYNMYLLTFPYTFLIVLHCSIIICSGSWKMQVFYVFFSNGKN